MQGRITEEDRTRILELDAIGWSRKRIAEKLGVTESAVATVVATKNYRDK